MTGPAARQRVALEVEKDSEARLEEHIGETCEALSVCRTTLYRDVKPDGTTREASS